MDRSSNPDISVVIPALNEEEAIAFVVQEVKQALKGEDFEILVVDGNSTDCTVRRALGAGGTVIVEPRRGYGRAYKTGFDRARGKVIVTLDGDGSYPASYIPYFLQYLRRKELDFISGNRFGSKGSAAMSTAHVLGNRILNLVASILFSIDIEDSQSGLWVIRKSIIEDIMPKADDMSFSQELKIRALKLARAREISIHYRPRIGRAKLHTFRDGLRNLLQLLKLWVNWRPPTL